MDIGVAEIDRWHRARGWRMVGYHYIIRRDGTVENGRPVEDVGAHAAGNNHHSIGICMVGGVDEKNRKPENNFTPEQFTALTDLLTTLHGQYPHAMVIGHCDVSTKACPSFNVNDYLHDAELEHLGQHHRDTCPTCGQTLP